jgi:hypothetical protein
MSDEPRKCDLCGQPMVKPQEPYRQLWLNYCMYLCAACFVGLESDRLWGMLKYPYKP